MILLLILPVLGAATRIAVMDVCHPDVGTGAPICQWYTREPVLIGGAVAGTGLIHTEFGGFVAGLNPFTVSGTVRLGSGGYADKVTVGTDTTYVSGFGTGPATVVGLGPGHPFGSGPVVYCWSEAAVYIGAGCTTSSWTVLGPEPVDAVINGVARPVYFEHGGRQVVGPRMDWIRMAGHTTVVLDTAVVGPPQLTVKTAVPSSDTIIIGTASVPDLVFARLDNGTWAVAAARNPQAIGHATRRSLYVGALILLTVALGLSTVDERQSGVFTVFPQVIGITVAIWATIVYTDAEDSPASVYETTPYVCGVLGGLMAALYMVDGPPPLIAYIYQSAVLLGVVAVIIHTGNMVSTPIYIVCVGLYIVYIGFEARKRLSSGSSRAIYAFLLCYMVVFAAMVCMVPYVSYLLPSSAKWNVAAMVVILLFRSTITK